MQGRDGRDSPRPGSQGLAWEFCLTAGHPGQRPGAPPFPPERTGRQGRARAVYRAGSLSAHAAYVRAELHSCAWRAGTTS